MSKNKFEDFYSKKSVSELLEKLRGARISPDTIDKEWYDALIIHLENRQLSEEEKKILERIRTAEPGSLKIDEEKEQALRIEKEKMTTHKTGMFQNPFSFEGRIRRTEYGITLIIFAIAVPIINAVIQPGGGATILVLAYIPMLWFWWAQSAKRCHDRGNSGWFQIIPFYYFWMLFADSDNGNNEYGPNPKGIGNQEGTTNV